MIRTLVLLASGLLAALLQPLPALAQTTHIVTVGDNFFSPSELTIQAGDTVRWVNAPGGAAHNVRSLTGAWTENNVSSSFEFEVTFNVPGGFPYDCRVHPLQMTGTVTVEGAGGAEVELLSVDALDPEATATEASGGKRRTTIPQAFAPDDELMIAVSIRNNGSAGTGAFNITYYASTDATITAADTALGTRPVPDIGPGATRNQQDTVPVPGSLPGGPYFIGAILSLADANAGNNTAVDNVSVLFTGPLLINAGMNDAWVIDGVRRQGILFAVLTDVDVFFGAWFTYDVERPPQEVTAILGEPGHRWVTLQGTWEGDTATLQIFLTAGGEFDQAEPLPADAVAIGTMTIVFHTCNNATATYEIPAPGPTGTIPQPGLSNTITLTRATPGNVALCEELSLALQGEG